MLRPVAMFGALIALAMALVMMVLVPRSGAILAERTKAIRSDLANALIVERQFLHPMDGLTLFITDTSRSGEMAGIFLNDQRDPERPVTYSAQHARLVREGKEARLVMLEGVALALGASGEQLTAVRFDQFVFDLSALIADDSARVPRPSEYQVGDLLHPTAAMLAGGHYTLADYVAEGHYKITLPLLAMIYPMIALVTLLAGGYRRSGFGERVVVAVGVAALLADPALRGARPGAGPGRALAADVPAAARGRRLPHRAAGAAVTGRRAAGPAGMTLSRYILRGFLRSVLAVFAVIALVIILFTSVENLRRFGESGANAWRRAAHHPPAGAGGALPGVPAGADAREPRSPSCASPAPASSW